MIPSPLASPSISGRPVRGAFAALVLLGVLLAVAPAALADEILYRDPEACAELKVQATEIVSETETEVVYRDAARGPEKSIPTAQVIEIRRDLGGDPSARRLVDAIGELSRGSFAEARRSLQALSGGGYAQDMETGTMVYKSFSANDPPGRKKRPPWTSEYAHFHYAKALFEEGLAKKDKELLKQAYLALVDQKVPGEDGTTGGFLGRFDGGNSRFYPEAMLLAARSLVELGRYDEAAKAYNKLYEKAISVDIGPRWAYEAKLGPSVIAEAQGKHLDALNAAEDAANFMKLLLPKETRACIRREIGKYYSRARMEAARLMLERAEKNRSPADFRKLREFIEAGMPERLRKTFGTLPESQLEPLVEGAMDSAVQSVAQLGLGLAYLYEKEYEKAILAFRSVEVKYSGIPEEHARALHYLAEAADQAAKGATGEARALYERWRDQATERLKKEHPDSPWARGG